MKLGDVINERYEIVSQIGKGGSSLVYLVKDRHVDKYVALKKIIKRDGLSVMLAKRERTMLRAIEYKMFPRILDAWQDKGALYIISDYIEGISLDKVIGNKGISRRQAYKWSMAILMALEYLHGLSPPILYLDLKPENILVKCDGTLALVDFGIAGRITTNLVPLGTRGYAAPEQYELNRSNITQQTDIYAFGMTYYYMRCGIYPDEDPKINIYNIKCSKSLSYREKSFLKKCIEIEPEKRFSSISQVKKAIKHFNSIRTISRKKINLIVIALITIVLGFFVIQRIKIENTKMQAATNLATTLNNYIENGEYSREGIKLIVTFINSGCLDYDTEQEFIFEVAKNYFEVQRDYPSAKKYFERLDTTRYPEALYMSQLCELEESFEFDESKANKCIGEFYYKVKCGAMNERKYEDIYFIATCYENYSKDKLTGIKKALAVLEGSYKELGCVEDGINISVENRDITEKYKRKMELLEKRARQIERNGNVY